VGHKAVTITRCHPLSLSRHSHLLHAVLLWGRPPAAIMESLSKAACMEEGPKGHNFQFLTRRGWGCTAPSPPPPTPAFPAVAPPPQPTTSRTWVCLCITPPPGRAPSPPEHGVEEVVQLQCWPHQPLGATLNKT